MPKPPNHKEYSCRVNILKYVKVADKWRFAPAQTQNNKLKQDWVLVDGSPERHVRAVFLRTNVTADAIRKRLSELAEGFQKPETAKNVFIRDVLNHAELIKQALLNKPWQPWIAPTGMEFITSDNPAVSFCPTIQRGISSRPWLRETRDRDCFSLGSRYTPCYGDSRAEFDDEGERRYSNGKQA